MHASQKSCAKVSISPIPCIYMPDKVHVRTYTGIYVRTYVCMYVCMYTCMYVRKLYLQVMMRGMNMM